ncbi:MAG: PDZ domain-containing protein [Fimbriimonadaceae bacterium]|nr:PDZ domain-containing protein [Fimbriimonadaceae bacterium]
MRLLQRVLVSFAIIATALPVLAQETTGQQGMSAEAKKEVIAGLTNVVKERAFVPGVDFTKWDEFIKSKEQEINDVKSPEQLSDLINEEMVRFFKASHLVLINPKAAEARKDRSAVGVGIRVEGLEEGLRVVKVFPDTPAAIAGIQPGDVVLEADGRKLKGGMTFQGPVGTNVGLKVKRGEDILEFTIERKKYSIDEPDTLTWLDNETAVLQVHTFMDGYSSKRIETLMTEAQKAKRIVLDLRGNGGGIVLNMMNLLGYFLDPDDAFGYFVNSSMVKKYEKDTMADSTDLKKVVDHVKPRGMTATKSKLGLYKGSLAVLVDGGSGSASEITAMALREFRGAPVIGSKSAGAVLVSMIAELPNGWQVQFPFMDYISARGVRLEGNGVVPDSEARTPRFGEKDTAPEIAKQLLEKKPNALSGGGKIGA